MIDPLNNWRHHDLDRGPRAPRWLVDHYSSAFSFPHWTKTIEKPPDYEPLLVTPPRTRLLIRDWRGFGGLPKIDPYERPGQGFWTMRAGM